MAEYPDFKHGEYGEIETESIPLTDKNTSKMAMVYFGTAPVHLVEGGAANVNVPMLINNIGEAKKYMGYSDNWEDYTLCEPEKVHFMDIGVGPLVFINVLDPKINLKTADTTESKTPSDGAFTISDADLVMVDTIQVATKVKGTDYTATVNSANNTVVIAEKTSGSLGTDPLTVTYKKQAVGNVTLTPNNGRVTIANAEDAILDSLKVMSGATEKTKGTDYTASYVYSKKAIDIVEAAPGSLGTDALTITWSKIDPSTVTIEQLIGATDNYGLNTGLYTIKNVYNKTGYVPMYMLAPGFSSIPVVHAEMYQNSLSIGKHWNAWMFVDMPVVDSLGSPITLANAADWKNANGYNKDNEDVFFPLAKGADGKNYHLSVLAAANFQELLVQNKGVPSMTASNTACPIIEDLFFAENVKGRVYDDEVINRCLNSNGIFSAAYISGRWAIWGGQAASYNQDDGTSINVFDTSLMMLFYLTNDFQHRRNKDIDKPMTASSLKMMRSEEQERIDRMLGTGALMSGKALLDGSQEAKSDILAGDFRIRFEVTPTPKAKSLTVTTVWTDDGYEAFYEAMEEAVS